MTNFIILARADGRAKGQGHGARAEVWNEKRWETLVRGTFRETIGRIRGLWSTDRPVMGRAGHHRGSIGINRNQ